MKPALTQKEGPASVGALPTRGSTNPSKGMDMNALTHTTAALAAATLDDLITTHEIALAADEAAWHAIPDVVDLPLVRVLVGRLLTGRDDDGKDTFKPIYAYDREEVERSVDRHTECQIDFHRGNASEAFLARREAHKAKLLAEYDALDAERQRVEDACGYTSALAAARLTKAAVEAIKAQIIAHVPATLAEATRLARWALDQHEREVGYVEEEDLKRVLQTIARVS